MNTSSDKLDEIFKEFLGHLPMPNDALIEIKAKYDAIEAIQAHIAKEVLRGRIAGMKDLMAELGGTPKDSWYGTAQEAIQRLESQL